MAHPELDRLGGMACGEVLCQHVRELQTGASVVVTRQAAFVEASPSESLLEAHGLDVRQRVLDRTDEQDDFQGADRNAAVFISDQTVGLNPTVSWSCRRLASPYVSLWRSRDERRVAAS